MTKAIKKGKIDSMIIPFPFKNLGTTVDYVMNKGQKAKDDLRVKLEDYLTNEVKSGTSYYTKIENMIMSLM